MTSSALPSRALLSHANSRPAPLQLSGQLLNDGFQRLIITVTLLLFFANTAFSQAFTPVTPPKVAGYLEQARQHEQSGDWKEASRYMNEAAMSVWEAKLYPEAIRYFRHSIGLNERIHNISGIAKIHSNLGMIYADRYQYDSSLYFFQLAMDYRKREGEKSEIVSTYVNIAVVLNDLNRYTEAASNLESALQLATEMSDAAQMKSCYGMLAETYEKLGNQERMLHYFNLYRTFHEMIQRNKVVEAKKETEAARLEALELELDKREKELELFRMKQELGLTEAELRSLSAEAQALIEENTKQQLAMRVLEHEVEIDKLRISETTAQNQRQRLWIVLAVVGLTFTVGLAIMLYRNNSIRKKMNVQLAEHNEEIKVLNEGLESQVQHRTAELQTALRKLEKRNTELDQFSHVISHNLRGPVASILGLGRVLNPTAVADPMNREVFERVIGAAENLDAVVKDLSVILEVRDSVVTKTSVSIRDSIAQASTSLKTEIEQTKTIVDIDDKAASTVMSVKPYLNSIFFNLLSNAIKYRSPQRAPHIRICTQSTSRSTTMTVSDNGIGIGGQFLDQVFQPYKRLTTEGDGKGLGLYLVKSEVEVMGGTIEVSSKEGEGTTFTIELPNTN